MKRLRSILFWSHLAAGVLAGLVILVMSFTGAVLALKPQILDFVERDVRVVTPRDTPRLTPQQILAAASGAKPGVTPQQLSMERDPEAAAVGFGRDAGTVYVNPYDGLVLGGGSGRANAFFQSVTSWHRYLNLSSPSRAETVATSGSPGAAPAAAKPFLRGVVLNDTKSRAYLGDPASKKVFGYVVGDSVGGGRLDAIKADRVIIVRLEGPVEVLLRDPSKPQPTATVSAGATGAPGAPAPPRPLQSIPPDFLRRSPVLPQPEEAR